MFGHGLPVKSASFSGERLATASGDGPPVPSGEASVRVGGGATWVEEPCVVGPGCDRMRGSCGSVQLGIHSEQDGSVQLRYSFV